MNFFEKFKVVAKDTKVKALSKLNDKKSEMKIKSNNKKIKELYIKLA